MIGFLRLGTNGRYAKLEWLTGATDIFVQLSYGEDNNPTEPYLSDVPPDTISRKETSNGSIRLVVFRAARYVFTTEIAKVDRNLAMEDVLGTWLGTDSVENFQMT